MSDDKAVGTVCGINRRHFVGWIALFYLAFGWIYLFYLILIKYILNAESLTPKHCSGPHCDQIISCLGFWEATMHINDVLVVFSGIIFGYLGVCGTHNRVPYEVHAFMMFCGGKVCWLLAMIFADTVYYEVCQEYPYNVASQALQWPIPNVPVPEQVKSEVGRMQHTPIGFLMSVYHSRYPAVAQIDVWEYYYLRIIPEMILLLWTFREAWILCDTVAYGPFGLGASYSMKHWKNGVHEKNEMMALLKQSQDDARTDIKDFRSIVTGEDIPHVPQDNWWPRGAPGYGYGGPPPMVL